MIKIRLVEKKELYSIRINDCGVVQYETKDFYRILNGNTWDEEKFPPFRDECSQRLIKEVDNAEFVPNDWYSMVTPYGRTCLSALCSGTKYGLSVIYYSSRGLYTTFEYIGENVWEILKQLPIDILIVLPVEDVRSYFIFPEEMLPLEIENYPYEDEIVRCILHNTGERDYFKDGILYKEGSWLNIGKDYKWLKDLNGVLSCLDSDKYNKYVTTLIKPVGNHTYTEFSDLLNSCITSIMDFPYTYKYDWLNDCTEEEWYKQELEKSMQTEEYQEYRYFVDNVKIVNHLQYKPEEAACKYCPYLIIERSENGSYKIKQSVSVKNPSFEEAFNDIKELVTGSAKKVILVLNTEADLKRVEDIRYVYFGMIITENQIELFDKNEALIEFREFLREAINSGNYIVESR